MDGATADGDAVDGNAAGVWTGEATGAGGTDVCAAGLAGCGVTAFCCAEANDVSDTKIRAAVSEGFIRDVLNIAAFIPRPSSE